VARLAPGFRVSAVSPEDAVIEAFEYARPDARPFLLAVQWHPEGMETGLPLADGVLDALITGAQH
jgi:gamma-glutamyl-gamma-aminobutyrate hydrolase PuuD